MEWARCTGLVTPQQLKRGVRIVVNNYDKYQSKETPYIPPTVPPCVPAINKGRRKEEKNITNIPTNTNVLTNQDLELVEKPDIQSFGRDDINTLIQAIKNECDAQKVIYDVSYEREFARHILTAKVF